MYEWQCGTVAAVLRGSLLDNQGSIHWGGGGGGGGGNSGGHSVSFSVNKSCLRYSCVYLALPCSARCYLVWLAKETENTECGFSLCRNLMTHIACIVHVYPSCTCIFQIEGTSHVVSKQPLTLYIRNGKISQVSTCGYLFAHPLILFL